uniref:AlNc14C456G11760 protein n=1 Tax=Albugo laibachii Nc14 TaxID=890382 RepID=F0X019_9STRA|nr:AlNc14C456G11760 [Albugo laibachii Nc14]|eukprot:CCA27101.1 AlNc14C456G11760 [Albugo laibachii Nc14]
MLAYLFCVQASLLEQSSHEEGHRDRLILQCEDLQKSMSFCSIKSRSFKIYPIWKAKACTTFELMLAKVAFSIDEADVIFSYAGVVKMEVTQRKYNIEGPMRCRQVVKHLPKQCR